MVALESVQRLLGLSGGLVGLAVLLGSALFSLVLFALAVQMLSMMTTRREVREPGIWFVTGGLGAGKSYFLAWVGRFCSSQRVCDVRGWRSAVRDGLVDGSRRRSARPVFSNVWFRGQSGSSRLCSVPAHRLADGSRDPECRRLHSWDELIAVPWGSVVLLDESHLWWSGVEWDVSEDLEAWVSFVRKRGVTLLCNSQSWRFTSTRLRRLTAGVWRGRRVFGFSVYSLFAPAGFDDERPARARAKGRLVLVRRGSVMASYRTLEQVAPVDPPRRSRPGVRPRGARGPAEVRGPASSAGGGSAVFVSRLSVIDGGGPGV